MRSLLICLLFGWCSGYKILAFFPMPYPSHYNFAMSIVSTLLDNGHEVVMVSPFIQPNPLTNLKQIEVKNAGVKGFKELYKWGNLSYVSYIDSTLATTLEMTEQVFNKESVQNLSRSGVKFDVVLIQEVLAPGYIHIGAHFEAPVILVAAMPLVAWSNVRLSTSNLPAYRQNIMCRGWPEHSRFWYRLHNTVSDLFAVLYERLVYMPKALQILHKYSVRTNLIPDIDRSYKQASLVFVNQHLSLYGPLPQQPNIVEIAGFHIKPPKPLPLELAEFMDASPQGVILFSMGSIIRGVDLPPFTIRTLYQVFSKLPLNVLWKLETEQVFDTAQNIKIVKWLPQNDILAHRNIKAFITHSGLFSIIESVYFGVPIIGLPVFSDQLMNIRLAEIRGHGISVPFNSLSEEVLTEALHRILTNDSFKVNAMKYSEIVRDRPIQPVDLVLQGIDKVVRRHGAKHLKYSGMDIVWHQRFLFDVLLSLFLAVALFWFVLWCLCRRSR